MAERRRAALPPGLSPRFLSREEAASYVGVAPETFDREVALGEWPPARRRGEKGTRLTWDRMAIDAYADRASRLGELPDSTGSVDVDVTAAAEAAALKGVADAARSHGLKHRQPKAA